jgi:hypothetical protein
MKKYYQNLKTKSLYVVVYETQVPSGIPFDGVEWIILECLKKYPTEWDQEIVTIPKSLLSKYFTADVNRDRDNDNN